MSKFLIFRHYSWLWGFFLEVSIVPTYFTRFNQVPCFLIPVTLHALSNEKKGLIFIFLTCDEIFETVAMLIYYINC